MLTRKRPSADGIGRSEQEERLRPFAAECLLGARWRRRVLDLYKERQSWSAADHQVSVVIDRIEAPGDVGGVFLEVEALAPAGAGAGEAAMAVHDLCRALRLTPAQAEPRSNLERLLARGKQGK